MSFLFSSPALRVLGVVVAIAASTLTPIQAAKPPRLSRTLARDLKAIRTGTEPTAAQIQALADDLAALFRGVDPTPTAALNLVAGRLARIVAQGNFSEADLHTIALELPILFNRSVSLNNRQVAVIQFILEKAGITAAEIDALRNGLQALAYSFQYSSDSRSRSLDLATLQPEVKGYRQAYCHASLDDSYSPNNGFMPTPTPAQDTYHSLTVYLSQAPRGNYHVSVTTGAGTVTEFGSFRVQRGRQIQPAFALENPAPPDDPVVSDPADAPTTDDPAPTDGGDGSYDPIIATTGAAPPGSIAVFPPTPPRSRYGSVTFGDSPYYTPLPAGLSLKEVTAITVTDDAGTPQFTGNVANADDTTTSRFAQLRLLAGEAAPGAGGGVSFGVFRSSAIDLPPTFLLSAVGLPANATLNLLIDGKLAGPVTTGPTGNLYVKGEDSVFPKRIRSGEVVNPLPGSTDFFQATSLTLTDSQGKTLLSGSLPAL